MKLRAVSSFRVSHDEQLLGQAIQCRNPSRALDAVRELVAQIGTQNAVAMATRNGVACIAGHGIADRDASNDTPAEASAFSQFRRAHEVVAADIRTQMAELDAVASLFQSHGIPLVALKNVGIARGIFPCPGCNPMGDLDVLVRRGQFHQAHRLLLDYGYTLRFRGKLAPAAMPLGSGPGQSFDPSLLEYAEATGGSEYHRLDAQGKDRWLELQWRPVAGRWIRPDQEPAGEELIERSLAIEGSDARLLAPADNLLQVALHTAKHSYVRAPGFRLHTDVDRIASLAIRDWDPFLRAVRQFQVRTPVYFSLLLARELLETPIPADILRALQPPAWREQWITESLQQVGLFDPDAAKFRRLHFILFCGLLYDDWRGLARAAFPSPRWMQQRYGCPIWQLPWNYLRRGLELVLRHQDT